MAPWTYPAIRQARRERAERKPIAVHLSPPATSMLPLCVWVLPGDTAVSRPSGGYWMDYDPCNVTCAACIDAAMSTPGMIDRLCA